MDSIATLLQGAGKVNFNQSIAEILKQAVNPFGSPLSNEKLARAGIPDDVLQRLALLRPPVDQDDAEIRWGKPSKFQISEPDQPDQITYTTITNTTVTTTDPPPGTKVLYFDEFKRQEETIRVENPDDSEQYVMVRRLQWIIFQGRDDGIFRVFTFTNPDAG